MSSNHTFLVVLVKRINGRMKDGQKRTHYW